MDLRRDVVSEATDHEIIALRRQVVTLDDLLADQGRRLAHEREVARAKSEEIAWLKSRICNLERQVSDLLVALEEGAPRKAPD